MIHGRCGRSTTIHWAINSARDDMAQSVYVLVNMPSQQRTLRLQRPWLSRRGFVEDHAVSPRIHEQSCEGRLRCSFRA